MALNRHVLPAIIGNKDRSGPARTVSNAWSQGWEGSHTAVVEDGRRGFELSAIFVDRPHQGLGPYALCSYEKSEPCSITKRAKTTILSWRMGNVALNRHVPPAINGNKGHRSVPARTMSHAWSQGE